MKLYGKYPKSVEVNGRAYPIETDFRRWIEFHDIALQSGDDEQKIRKILRLFNGQYPDDIAEAVNALCDFYAAGQLKDHDDQKGKKVVPNYDFEFDQDYFISGFRENYGISLLSIGYLHWWEFLALFRGMNADTELKQRMQLRAVDIGQIKDVKEKSRIRKAQMSIAIPRRDMEDEEIGDAFASVI